MKLTKKTSWILLVVGLVFIALALLVGLDIINESETYFKYIMQTMTSLALIGIAYFLLVPEYKKVSNKHAKALVFLEIIVIIAAAIIGFILPMFGLFNAGALGSGSLWVCISLVLYAGGALFFGVSNYKKVKTLPFIGYLALIILGVIISERSLLEMYLKTSLIVVLALVGLYALFKWHALKFKKN